MKDTYLIVKDKILQITNKKKTGKLKRKLNLKEIYFQILKNI